MDAGIIAELENPLYKEKLQQTYDEIREIGKGHHITAIAYSKLPSELEVRSQTHPAIMVISPRNDDIQVGFKLVGYLVRKELPPVTTSTRLPTKASWARQFVSVGGLSLPGFDKALKTMATLYHMFAIQAGGDTMQPFVPAVFNGHQCLNFTRRWFSPTSDGTAQLIPPELDPTGRLAKLGKGLHYNEDNRVVYRRRVQKEVDGQMKFVPENIQPSSIQTGQLVEVQFTLSAKLCKSNKWKVFHDLSAITIVDNSIDKWVLERKLQSLVLPVRGSYSGLSKKRTVDYGSEDEEMGGARKQFRLMVLNDEIVGNEGSSPVADDMET